MSWLILALNEVAILFAASGAIICAWYAWRCKADDRVFYAVAAILQAFTVAIYLTALFGDWYIIRSGILSRLAAVMYSGLLMSWAIAHMRRCDK
jgi:hypothetical protein